MLEKDENKDLEFIIYYVLEQNLFSGPEQLTHGLNLRNTRVNLWCRRWRTMIEGERGWGQRKDKKTPTKTVRLYVLFFQRVQSVKLLFLCVYMHVCVMTQLFSPCLCVCLCVHALLDLAKREHLSDRRAQPQCIRAQTNTAPFCERCWGFQHIFTGGLVGLIWYYVIFLQLSR